jgi:hypothetical protein
MAELTFTVPQSATVTAADVIAAAAERAGYTAEHEGTAEQFLARHLAEHVHTLYRSALIDRAAKASDEELPPPERQRVLATETAIAPGNGNGGTR